MIERRSSWGSALLVAPKQTLKLGKLLQKARVESGLVGAQESEMFIKRHEKVGYGLFRTCANAMRRPDDILHDVLSVRVVEDGDRGDLRSLADR